LTAEQKRIRLGRFRELLHVLSVQMARQWHDIVTLDESWIYLYRAHDLMWMAPGEIVPDRERQIVKSPTLMLTIVWNPSGIPHCESPSKGWQIQRTVLYEQYPYSYLRLEKTGRGKGPNKLWVHANNARPHNAQVSTDFIAFNPMKQAPHPPYSPDLAPTDFFLFGDVTRKLIGYHAESPSELLIRIRDILSDIPREPLNAVFLEWMA
jgi:histone-lysine N-methyltransferase SETMAR